MSLMCRLSIVCVCDVPPNHCLCDYWQTFTFHLHYMQPVALRLLHNYNTQHAQKTCRCHGMLSVVVLQQQESLRLDTSGLGK